MAMCQRAEAGLYYGNIPAEADHPSPLLSQRLKDTKLKQTNKTYQAVELN